MDKVQIFLIKKFILGPVKKTLPKIGYFRRIRRIGFSKESLKKLREKIA